ncbi:TM0106 family RecB-like putative nuclease [Novosphingobium sp. BW1]|uniref:TM0106 family RecB-like putative nuclease n=1 Tax=Novosphingobium sp. BW1 TaxID=2592621 RepID=UPI0011DE96D5|nr:TM0106 family RecB-like putative nuclease [Novosphingobium sp. BW1]TYC83804.1 TM0106 family RecB-like putative nuclease [Novosphingobium sp. BW1]
MRMLDGKLRLSASDLMRFKGCRHATTLDLRHIEVGDIAPSADGDEAVLLQRQGDAHELAFLESLRQSGRSIVEIAKDGVPLEKSVELTTAAMREGPDVIFQGALFGGAWGGYTDFLERTDTASALGPWSYEVVDTKLKRKPDPKHVLQLSLYSDLLTDVQQVRPEAAHLQLGDGSRFSVRLTDVASYARHARGVLETFLEDRPETRSEPVSGCGLCRWKDHCRSEWERADSLSLVAGITKSQRGKLEAFGVTTLNGLADMERKVPKLSPEVQSRLTTQAKLQRKRREGGPPGFELRDFQLGKGFGLMPQPDEGDLFYDIEGDPYYEGGLEYLHGVWFRDNGEWTFRAFWAHDREAEGRAVAELLEFFVQHLRTHPLARIYHYANYEIAALRRLTAAHRVGEAAMDQLQRERRFVDLFKVVSGSLIASEKGYSIKDLEAFYMPKREADVATAGASVVFYENWRETGDDQLLDKIYDYNRTDCISTQLLRDWLLKDVRPAEMPWPRLGEVPDGGALSNVATEDEEVEALRARLGPVRSRLGVEVADLLLDLNFFHKREDKPAWWAIFDRLAQESEDLIDDLECIQGLEAVGEPVKVTAKSFERTYRFPLQETKLRAGKKPCVKPAAMPEDVDLRELDAASGTLVLRRSTTKGPLPDQLDLIPGKPIANGTLRNAVATVIEEIIQDTGRARAIEQLLTRALPEFSGGPRPGGIIDTEGDLPTQTSSAIADMAATTLAIQGPPGTGKTYVSAMSIVDLVRSGKRIAVSSNSHKAIGNLLEAIADRATTEGVSCRVVQKANDDGDDDAHPGITLVQNNDAPEIASAHVMGATAWHFARYDAPAFDYLFVDEAGQVSLANIMAMSRAARNLVLVGDPMQLPQPLQGTHPGRSGESCLEYLIDGHRVVPGDRGIFMPVSRRMHPSICGFISAAVYEDRLHPDEAAGKQSLNAADGTSLLGSGVRSIAHTGRSQVCPEEIEAIEKQISKVLGSTYHGRDGAERIVGHSDILVVAPYNAQVNALRAALPPGIRVGTVDRFQGQEAPVCLVSMTTSSGEELPRDIDFLFSLNRINVAVSRAQASAVVFASPLLLETPCRTVPEMMLVNALCLLREHGGDSF